MSLFVSVIMAAYNSESFIEQSIESILAQTHRNLELIIVNDGSVDSTLKIIKSFDDQRIILIDSRNNEGIALSRNKGLAIARGEFIALCDSDDLWEPLTNIPIIKE